MSIQSNGVALYRGGGSIGIIGACRAAMVVGRDPDNPSTRVLAPTKSNLAPMPKALIYDLESVGDVARIAWGGESELTADDIIEHTKRKRQKAGEQCAEAIGELLSDGPMAANMLDDLLKQRGFAGNSIRAGKKAAGVVTRRDGFGPGAKYRIWLPEDAAAADTANEMP